MTEPVRPVPAPPRPLRVQDILHPVPALLVFLLLTATWCLVALSVYNYDKGTRFSAGGIVGVLILAAATPGVALGAWTAALVPRPVLGTLAGLGVGLVVPPAIFAFFTLLVFIGLRL